MEERVLLQERKIWILHDGEYSRRILGSSCYHAFCREHERIGGDKYWNRMLQQFYKKFGIMILKK